MAGFLEKLSDSANLNSIADSIKKLANLGLKYNDQIVKQSRSVGPTEALFSSEGPIPPELLWSLSVADSGDKKYIAYFDKEYKTRREFLRKFAMNGEIEWILDTITDECVVYDERNFFCQPIHNFESFLKPDIAKTVIDKLDIRFKQIYTHFHFSEGALAWQLFKQFMIDGFLAFEIIYDEPGKNIIGFKQIDPISLQPRIKDDATGLKRYWVQYDEIPQLRRELLDSQVIYLSYGKGNYTSRISYTERLVRSHNMLRLMEHTRAIWNIMNATYRLKMVVPIGTASKQRAQESLTELAAFYKEDVYLDVDSGELLINGKASMQFYKNYIMPSKNGESPEIETLAGEGPELNDTDIITYFHKKLKIDSKIPLSRFERDGSATYSISAEGLDREEIRFFKFINRLRSMFQEIMIKPLYLQMCLDVPELADDEMFKSGLGIKYHKDGLFEELKQMELITKRLDFINSMKDYTQEDGSTPFFSPTWLVDRFLNLSTDDLKQNQAYINANKKEETPADSANDVDNF